MPSSGAQDAAALAAGYLLEEGEPSRRLMTWDSYKAGLRVFESLTNIQEFAFILDIPPVPEISQSAFASQLATDLYSSVLAAVDQSEFFHEDEIKLGTSPGRVSIDYEDDRYDFYLRVTANTIRVGRNGSRFEDFHNWYVAFAPRLPTLVAGVLDVLRTTTQREYRAFRGAFIYQFILYDLEFLESGTRARNSDIIKRIIRGVPDDSGAMSEADETMRSASRIDVNMTRWVNIQHGKRLERYSVEGPANKEGAGLWLQFAYGGETYTAPDSGAREPFEHRAFITEHSTAYTSFLRDKAIGAFLTSLMRGFSFRSSSANLP